MPHSIMDLLSNLARKNYNEYAGSCPWCGGNDRFIVWPHQGHGGRYLCRQCQRKGDGIDYLRDQGLSFSEAKIFLNLAVAHKYTPNKSPENSTDRAKSSVDDPDLWKSSAQNFIKKSCLKKSIEKDHILGKKALNEDTASKFKIGWNDRDQYLSAPEWGLNDKKLKIPAGLVIPIYKNEDVISIKIRCSDQIKNPKYWYVRGSSNYPMILGDSGIPVLIVESELDAVLIWQEASARVAVIALGGLNSNLDITTIKFIEKSPKILVSTDYDASIGCQDNFGPGQTTYFKLKEKFPNAVYFPTPIGKDPCEMHTAGVSISDWISTELATESSSKEIPIPPDFPGSAQYLLDSLQKFPHLVPCPITNPKWAWKYRKDCGKCGGHIHCVKELKF